MSQNDTLSRSNTTSTEPAVAVLSITREDESRPTAPLSGSGSLTAEVRPVIIEPPQGNTEPPTSRS